MNTAFKERDARNDFTRVLLINLIFCAEIRQFD